MLEHHVTGERHPLGQRYLVGRTRRCDLVIDDIRVSGYHAVLVWRKGLWWLRDLGSRNGSAVNGQRLAVGEVRGLERGDALDLGDPELRWRLTDAGPPTIFARSNDELQLPPEGSDLLVLPSLANPELCIASARDGWVLRVFESGFEQPVEDGVLVVAGGQGWRIFLPDQAPQATLDRGNSVIALLDTRLRIVAGPHGQVLDVQIAHGGRHHRIAPRAHHDLLLTLARRFVEQADKPLEVRGWMDLEEILARLPHVSEAYLTSKVCRVRKDFRQAGLDPRALTRKVNGGLRLVLGEVEIEEAALIEGAPSR